MLIRSTTSSPLFFPPCSSSQMKDKKCGRIGLDPYIYIYIYISNIWYSHLNKHRPWNLDISDIGKQTTDPICEFSGGFSGETYLFWSKNHGKTSRCKSNRGDHQGTLRILAGQLAGQLAWKIDPTNYIFVLPCFTPPAWVFPKLIILEWKTRGFVWRCEGKTMEELSHFMVSISKE